MEKHKGFSLSMCREFIIWIFPLILLNQFHIILLYILRRGFFIHSPNNMHKILRAGQHFVLPMCLTVVWSHISKQTAVLHLLQRVSPMCDVASLIIDHHMFPTAAVGRGQSLPTLLFLLVSHGYLQGFYQEITQLHLYGRMNLTDT